MTIKAEKLKKLAYSSACKQTVPETDLFNVIQTSIGAMRIRIKIKLGIFACFFCANRTVLGVLVGSAGE
jgi:hypothetical protein